MSSDAKLTLTYKAGSTFDSPWIVAYADSVDDALALDAEIAAKGLDVAVANTAKGLQAKYALASGGVPTTHVSTQSTQPAAAYAPQPTQAAAPTQAAPGSSGSAPTCAHGARVWKDFVSKKGNPIKGWFCTSPNRNDECPAQFAK